MIIVAESELYQFPITKQMMIELDAEFGGGTMKQFIESQNKLPSKVFIRKSTAMQLYFEFMECLYSREKLKKLQRGKKWWRISFAT